MSENENLDENENWKTPLAERVRIVRDELGLTQFDFALAIGIDAQSVSNYECGRMSPSNDTLAVIASMAGRDISWFFGGRSESAPTLLEALDADSRIDPAGKKAILAVYRLAVVAGSKKPRKIVNRLEKRRRDSSSANE